MNENAEIELTRNLILTTGYTGKGGIRALQAVLAYYPAVVVVDIRQRRWSRAFDWREANLRPALKNRYIPVPALGNVNYDKPLSIAIANLEGGIAALVSILKSGRTPLLLCGCEEFESCHRAVVAGALLARGYEVAELSRWEPIVLTRVEGSDE